VTREVFIFSAAGSEFIHSSKVVERTMSRMSNQRRWR